MMLQFRLRELLAEKARVQGERITLSDVAEKTGISIQVLSSLNSPSRQIVTNTAYLEALCRYFRCQPSELLVFRPPVDSDESCHVDDLYPERRREGRVES